MGIYANKSTSFPQKIRVIHSFSRVIHSLNKKRIVFVQQENPNIWAGETVLGLDFLAVLDYYLTRYWSNVN